MAFPRVKRDEIEQSYADYHVQGVQASHGEIKSEKQLGVYRIDVDLRVLRGQITDVESKAGNMMAFVLVMPLVALHAQEGQAKQHSQQQQDDQHLALPHLCGAHRQSDRQAAANQDRGVDGSDRQTQSAAGNRKFVRIPVAVDQVRAEQSTKEHDFRGEEQPHTQRRSIALLLHIDEMVLQ